MYKKAMKPLIVILLMVMSTSINAQEKANKKTLNILLFTADDLDRNSLGCYGSIVPDISPNIDSFARQSLKFEQAYVNSAICVPSRAIIATGLYSHHNGVNGFFKMKEDSTVPLLMEVLRAHSYAVGILGKLSHSTPKANFHWDFEVDQPDLGNGRSPELYYQNTKAFLSQRKEDDKPFYLMVNSHDPHRPFFNPDLPLAKGEERPSKIYGPEEISVPGFLPDLPGVRRELSYYFNSTRRLDDTFGKVLQALQESGYAENTLVVFLSDNGVALPFAKANAYNASNRTPFLVRWPGVTLSGSINKKDFISGIDIMPTFLDALHIPFPDKVDGVSFLELLKGGKQAGRNKIYAEIDYKAGGGPSPMRSIQDERYIYIYNAWANGEYKYANNNEGLTMKSMEEAASTDSAVSNRVKLYRFRQPEELYDLKTDPDALNNLIADGGLTNKLGEMRKDLEKWMKGTDDPLLPIYQNRDHPVMLKKIYPMVYPNTERRWNKSSNTE